MRSPSDLPNRQNRDEKARTLPGPPTREDRLKVALKANMARRKAQAKARSSEDASGPVDTETKNEG